ncbi:hypothetical protein IEO21_02640 [Rhodonia placenta]|uniref:Uncharacterized protein n=1 Tax=Rhodonia placenta TaxID=104341 RepID=A0A8H7U506_9APHY|nr:hypothetical protein IEO21_02640 [Postia placenta]
MRAPEPPYPSFALVMCAALNDTARLPAYREARRRRHHPYTRPPRRQTPDYLMDTIDYRDVDERDVVGLMLDSLPNAPAASDSAAIGIQDDVMHLDEALHGIKADGEGRRKLSTLIIDLALAVRRRCQEMCLVKKSCTNSVDLLD